MEKNNKNLNILLVDDEEDIREVLNIVLTDLGYNVYMAENGQEGLSIFKKIHVSIVITDIKMPGMDGIELLQKIKQENQDTEVIMITGHGDMDLSIKSLKYQAVDFITKPINTEALEITLQKVKEKITAREKLKEYTQKLEQLVHEKTELQDHLSSLGLMIGSISHSIKGLMTALDGGFYLISSGFEKTDNKQIKEGIETVRNMKERIKKMVLDILFYVKERELKKKRVNVLIFVKDTASIIESRINKHPIEFICNFDENLPDFEIDLEFMRSAMVNILDNAIDACLEDNLKELHQIIFSVYEKKGNIFFDIRDNGIGMDKETKEKIFNLFFSSKGTKGTGLGLFIANNIVKQHEGTINIVSAKDKGTLFSISIPV
jgi:signal transduction histidine kinase